MLKPIVAIHVACGVEHLDLVKYFIEELHMDHDHMNSLNETYLFTACKAGHLKVVEYLIDLNKNF
jgi:ankyrin repeat protein